MHACIRNQSMAHMYLSARQRLENYASTHAELSPMDYKAFLPSGRQVFYYYQYRLDMLERHGRPLGHGPSELGSTPRSSNVEPSTPTPKRGLKRRYPHSRNAQDAPSSKKDPERLNPRSPGEQNMLEGRPLHEHTLGASLGVFLRAWRVECPWIVVARSVSMFTRCSVCDYSKLLIEQTPRDQCALRERLKDRLGRHF